MEPLFESLQPDAAKIVCEASTTVGKNMWLSGVFMQAEQPNRNERIYPLSEMTLAVNSANNLIKENGGIFGELDHPEKLTINMDRISHAIKELNIVGNNVIGRAEIIRDTPMGAIAEALGKTGVRYGISSRGAGNVGNGGVVSGYVFVTADLVATPSVRGAYPRPVYEGLQNSKEGQRVLSLAESLQHDENAQKHFSKSILLFVDNVFNKM